MKTEAKNSIEIENLLNNNKKQPAVINSTMGYLADTFVPQ
jgi:hypothetical protein